MLGTTAELARGAPECLEREVRLEALWRQAIATWPGIDLDRVTFLAYVAARRPQATPLDDCLTNVHVGDLYLACACACRIPSAMELFNRAYLGHVNEYLRRIRPDSSFVDDVCQSLLEKLFVAVPGKITEYSGRGSLGGWVRVLAVRTAIDLRRRRGERLPDLQAERPSAIDPELGYLAERYRGEVEDALRRAITALNGEQRTLLRMHIIDAITLDELAQLRKVHRATIARHLAAARKTLLDQIRRELRERLAISTDELASLIQLVRSKIEISIMRLLTVTP